MKKIVTLFLIAGICMACSSDDDTQESMQIVDTLQGKWHLLLSECGGCAGNTTYEVNEHTYTFDLAVNTVVIEKAPNVPTQHPPGTYDVTINTENDKITIEPYYYEFDYYFENNNLIFYVGDPGGEWLKLHFYRN